MSEPILLPERCDIIHVIDMKTLCESSLKEEDAIIIDASQVEKLTTPAIQLLLAVRASCLADQREFSIIHPSSDYSNACALLGVADQLLEGELS